MASLALCPPPAGAGRTFGGNGKRENLSSSSPSLSFHAFLGEEKRGRQTPTTIQPCTRRPPGGGREGRLAEDESETLGLGRADVLT